MTFKLNSVKGMYSVYVYAKYDRHTSTEIGDIANKNFGDKKIQKTRGQSETEMMKILAECSLNALKQAIKVDGNRTATDVSSFSTIY
jgi:hypothetical protein